MKTGARIETDEPTPETDFVASGPRRVRGGPIAAIVATAGVLAATAVPAKAPRLSSFGMAPAVLVQGLEPVTPVGAAPEIAEVVAGVAVDLGPVIGRFELTETSSYEERADGTVRLVLDLERVGKAEAAGLSGVVEFRTPVATRLALDEGLALLAPRAEADIVPTAQVMEELPPTGTRLFRAIGGALEGSGALAGYQLSLRVAPGAAARAGRFGATGAAVATPVVCFLDEVPGGVPEVDLVRGWIAVARR